MPLSRTLRLALVCLLAFAALAPVAAEETAPETENWYLDKPIKEVTFTGLATVKPEELQPIVKPYVGQSFTFELFNQLQNAIVALDYFERVDANAKDPDGTKSFVVIEFQVVERPTISSIEIDGNRGVGRTDILGKVLLKKGDLVTDAKLRADVEAIRQLYLGKGYADVQVSSRSSPGDRTNSVSVTFQIVEGAQTKIKEVRFSSNVWASANTLRGLMKTKAQSLFESGDFQESRLEEDRLAIVDYYAEHGFVDAKVDRFERQVQQSDGKNELFLTVYLTEGEQWSYGGMSFDGNKVFSTEKLASLVYQKPGKVLNMKKVKEDYQRIIDLYTQNGYIFNQIDRLESRDTENRTISYLVKITEQDKAHIEKIVFKGNAKTADFVLRRGLPFEEGDVYNVARIEEGYRYLYNLQYFSNVVLDTLLGSAPGLIDLVFTVEEGSTADINFGVMFSGGDFPISGTIKWNERDFRGRGQTVGVDVEMSPVKQLASLNFYEPWLLGVPWSAGVSLSVDHSKETNVLQDLLPPVFSSADDLAGIAAPDPYATLSEYQAALAAGQTVPAQYLMSFDAFDISLGVNTGYRFRTAAGQLGVRGGVSSSFRYLTYDPNLYRPFDLNVRNNLNTFSIINSINPTVYLDGRDFPLNPTNGFYLSQGLTYTGGILLGDRHFIRTDSVLEGFLTLVNAPVSENWSFQLILAAHAGLSLILPQYRLLAPAGSSPGWTTVTDFTDLLYIDGMTVGRGWRQMYGKALWDNKLELRLPIAKNVLTGVFFFDAAGLWPEIGGQAPSLATMSLEDLFYSFGAGLRFTIPQFPIRLYLGKGFQVKNGQVVWKPGDISLPGGLSFSFIISLGGDVF